MSNINKKELSEALREAMDKEMLHTREAARLLNINPCYISMALNEKSWDHLGISAWQRIEDWLLTREPLKIYKFPEGEEVFVPKPYKPKEKPLGLRPLYLKEDLQKPQKAEEDDSLMHLPEPREEGQQATGARRQKEKSTPEKKQVLLMLNRSEIEALDKKFKPLFVQIENILAEISNIKQNATMQNRYINEVRNDVEKLKSLPQPSAVLSVPEEKPSKKSRYFAFKQVFNIQQK